MPLVKKSARRYARKTADRVLAETLQRIAAVNANDHYAFQVTRARLFGSMLTEAKMVGDIDLALEIVPRRFADERRWQTLWLERGGGEYWQKPYNEVVYAIKHRSPLVSIHDWKEPDHLSTVSRALVIPSGPETDDRARHG